MNTTLVNLVITCIFSQNESLASALHECVTMWGGIDYQSKNFAFDMTDYYTPEMGNTLKRVFFSFEKLISPEKCVAIKHECEAIEKALSVASKRTVNLDPGYIDAHKYVLMSYKYGGQKISVGNNVWADMTLLYRKGTWFPFEWTFPDFKDKRYYNELLKIREKYKIKSKGIEKFC